MKMNKKLSLVLIFFVVSIGLLCLSFYSLDPDYLWHIKAGERIFYDGIIKYDVFSWFLKGKYWMSHEWLFEWFIFFLKNIFGKFHIIIYCGFFLGLLFYILFYKNRFNISKNILFSIVWISLVVLISLNMQVRPHLISYFLLSLTIYILYDLYNNEDSKKIYFLPLIEILWSNVHGGSSNLVYILCFIFFLVGLFDFNYIKIEAKRMKKGQLLKYFLVGIICCFSVLINIHGFKMFIYPYQNMVDKTMINNISEWRSTSLNDPIHYIYILELVFIFLVMIFSKKKFRFIDFVMFFISAYLGLKSIRFWFYTYIIANFYIFYYIDKRKIDKGTGVGICLLSVLFVIIFVIRIDRIINVDYHYLLSKNDISEVKRLNAKRLFNMYDYGGDLIYNNIDVFIDGRADLYSKYNYKDYLKITNLDGDYISLLNKYNFDYMIVNSKYPINTYLKYSNNYDRIYKNKSVIIYKKMNYN